MIVPPLKGLNKCISMIAPGLAPWAMQEYRPLGAHYPTAPTIPPNNPPPQPIQSQSNKYKNTNERNNPFTHPKTFNEHNTTTQLRKRPIRQRALQGRYSCKAQGGMRAKPDMKPWVNANKRMKRALQGRHSCIAQGEMRAKPDMKPWVNTDNPTMSPERAALLHSPG